MNRFIIADPQSCIGCNTCMAGCSQVHEQQGLQSHPRLTVVRQGDFSAPMMCRNCEDAYCERVCPVNAITYGADTVVLNESLCIGCKLCAIACPFGAITPSGSQPVHYNPLFENYVPQEEMMDVPDSLNTLHPLLKWEQGVRSVAVKCDLCYFQELPECIKVCPSKAIKLIDDKALSAQTDKRRKAAIKALGVGVSFRQKDELLPH